MTNLFKMLGLLAFVLIGLGSAQTPDEKFKSERDVTAEKLKSERDATAKKFNSERDATIQKWSNSDTQFVQAKVGMTFDEVSQLSVKAGQGILMPVCAG
jgi:hypothetical protein